MVKIGSIILSSELLFVIIVIFLVLLFITIFLSSFLYRLKEKKIITIGGRLAKAKIIYCHHMGNNNHNPTMRLGLEVYDGNKAPYRVKTKAIVSYVTEALLKPGMIVNIKIDPRNPNRVILASE